MHLDLTTRRRPIYFRPDGDGGGNAMDILGFTLCTVRGMAHYLVLFFRTFCTIMGRIGSRSLLMEEIPTRPAADVPVQN